MTADVQVIHTAEGLDALAAHLRKERAVAVDVEADSMYHFQERVCLIQMATPDIKVVIDPLAVTDLSVLRPVFSGAQIQKIFHGADYDVRSLSRDFDIDINNLFDTQVACKFLGMNATGLEAVLQDRFGINLDKKYQRKDWSRRPLPDDMIAYAADDVRYLLPLAQELEKELREKGRLGWVREECALLSRVRSTANDGEPLYLHFKGAGRLNPRSLAVLEELLQFRRQVAARKDRPLFKVFSNKSLLQTALAKPADMQALTEIDAFSSKQLQMHGSELIAAVKRAVQIPSDKLPVYPRKKARPVHPAVPNRIRTLKAWRDKKAADLGVDPGVLFNKSLLTALAVEKPQSLKSLQETAELKNWQNKAFGREIVSLLKSVK